MANNHIDSLLTMLLPIWGVHHTKALGSLEKWELELDAY